MNNGLDKGGEMSAFKLTADLLLQSPKVAQVPTAELADRGHQFTLPPFAASPNGVGRISAVLDGPILRYAVAYLVTLTLARIPYDAERSAGLHNDSNSRARGSGRSANAVPRTGATAQRGHRGLATGDESTAIGALRGIISCLLSRGGDTQIRG